MSPLYLQCIHADRQRRYSSGNSNVDVWVLAPRCKVCWSVCGIKVFKYYVEKLLQFLSSSEKCIFSNCNKENEIQTVKLEQFAFFVYFDKAKVLKCFRWWGLSKKNPHTLKDCRLIKNSQFLSNPFETLGKLLPHEEIIFTKFHEDWTKIMDFSLMTNFCMCAVFSYSDFIMFFETP